MTCKMNRSVIITAIAVFIGVLLVVVIMRNISPSDSTADLRSDSVAKSLNFSKKTAFNISDLPQPLTVCGQFDMNRIVGGDVAGILEFPWLALIEHTREDGGVSYHCGGTLINKDYVLTAAHCIKGKKLIQNNWRVSGVRLGEWDLNSDPDSDNDVQVDAAVDIAVLEFIVHENYDPNSKNNEHDIGLLRLNHSIGFTDSIQPLCLPAASEFNEINYDRNATFIVAGWGRTEDAPFSDIKQKVDLPGYPLNQCIEKYRPKGIFLTENQFCAGGVPGRDSCKGDSGGAVMQLNIKNPLKAFMSLAGIVSFGKKKCGSTGWPGIYTRVDRYTDWILEHMRP